MSRRVTFIERLLSGAEVDLDAIDDAIDAWHSSGESCELHEWLGMSRDEYDLFVERPESLRLILLGRQHARNPRELLRAMDDNAIAARGTSASEVARIREWLKSTGRL